MRRHLRDIDPRPDPPMGHLTPPSVPDLLAPPSTGPVADPPPPAFPVADGLAAIAAALNRIADALERSR